MITGKILTKNAEV